MKYYDAIIIGSGGGSKLTRPVANKGFKVAIIEKGRLGGTCLNHGCIPSKMLIHSAELVSSIQDAHRFQINSQINSIDFKTLVERVNQTIDDESDSIQPLYDDHPNIDFYPTTATFESDKVIRVGDELITADRLFIAAGARPHIPSITGLESTPYMTYYDILRRTQQPKSLIIIGGGYIATELGYFMGSLGTDVQFVVRSEFLRPEDQDIKNEFNRIFSSQFQTHYGTPTHIKYDNDEFHCILVDNNGNEHTIRASDCLIATGITPHSDTLALQNTSIEMCKKGFIQVNDYLETSVPGVFAFGDIIGRHFFRHSANFEGQYLFDNLYESSSPQKIKYPHVPHAVFTHPQVASVGLTEQTLIEQNIPYLKGINSYADSAMGMALQSNHGFVKVLFHQNSKQLIGAHIIGEQASTMIHMLMAFMHMNATLDDMTSLMYIHPALPEIVRNAVRKVS